MTWLPTRSGLSVDLVHPTDLDVDFAEIAHALAHINRSAGNSIFPVSVGLHTLIGLDLCPTPGLRPHWLLHDAHEARLGDETTPRKEALRAVAEALFDGETARRLNACRGELEARHDAAIYRAAGLTPPSAIERQALKLVDLRALATERRDFYRRGPAPRPWAIDLMSPPPAPSTRVWRPMPALAVADRLLELFQSHLPALHRGRRAS